MNNTLFLALFILLTLLIVVFDSVDNKNKFRAALLFDGFINKLVLLAFICLLIMEEPKLGIMFLLGFFLVHLILASSEKELIEGFEDYFSSK